ncbi:hypothetical protein NP493_377g00042 [Ridgeia piscesae]|uniref:Uncharacterized protein n=1 Tax=Ridgeia piscesae TaxID=27915 RepID=A0AAD9NV44_RIDPI|nr:hypothetical protein NP493_377g00042 [Ridgeia piscesae]
MGVGGSKNPPVGVPANPRVIYADGKSRREKTPVLIDTPSLVKLSDGTVRYRFFDQPSAARNCKKRVEKPHEGPERSQKQGYFYHSRLNDFSPDASYDKEQDWKFRYVYKGPNRTRQKHLFYVYGKGLKSGSGQTPGVDQDKHVETETETQQLDGHLYYDMALIPKGGPGGNDDEDVEESADKQQLELFMNGADSVEKLKSRLSVHLITPPEKIHVIFHNKELR